MDEFLQVNFLESRQLVINGIPQGRTNMIVQLEAGTYDVSLADPKNFSPDSQRVTLRFTAITSPALLTFHVLPPSAVTPAAAGGHA